LLSKYFLEIFQKNIKIRIEKLFPACIFPGYGNFSAGKDYCGETGAARVARNCKNIGNNI
jgi:hypothetical protein